MRCVFKTMAIRAMFLTTQQLLQAEMQGKAERDVAVSEAAEMVEKLREEHTEVRGCVSLGVRSGV